MTAENVVFIGPIFVVNTTSKDVSEALSNCSQPRRQLFRMAASFNAAHTTGRGASISYWPVISIEDTPMNMSYCRGNRSSSRRCTQTLVMDRLYSAVAWPPDEGSADAAAADAAAVINSGVIL